ncbi:serine/threonine-protein kinase [Anatilimnocola sp. NA78]|uniref:serine/threonine-protein kinase n=1 Tax=Anatilimnocola sp. NA78 TaxID=3415683 RepID=UPI003CE5131E
MPSLLRPAHFTARETPRSRPRTLPYVTGYELAGLIASGNQFEIHRARATGQSKHESADYVIKAIRADIADRELARAVLHREVEVAQSVSHANLITVFDYQPDYAVLPYLPGSTLEQLLNQRAQVPVPQALWYVRQTADALAMLHSQGWLHGDVKPANLIVSDQGHVTLIDLGLARQLGSAECRTENWLAGDAAYLSPEALIPGYQLSTAADVFSLGLSLLQLLRGEAASPKPSLADNWHAASDLRVSRPDVSREVATLIAKMTANEPLRRPLISELLSTLSRLEIESLMQW